MLREAERRSPAIGQLRHQCDHGTDRRVGKDRKIQAPSDLREAEDLCQKTVMRWNEPGNKERDLFPVPGVVPGKGIENQVF